jgi:hypothetical protein
MAIMVAPEGHDEKMQFNEVSQKCSLSPVLDRQQFDWQGAIGIQKKMSGFEALVVLRRIDQRLLYKARKCVPCQK